MKYYTVINKYSYSNKISHLVLKNTEDVYLLSFNENDFETIESAFDKSFINSKRQMYTLEKGELQYLGKFKLTPNRWYQKFVRLYKSIHKEEKWMSDLLESNTKTLVEKCNIDIGKFNSFRFIDKDNGTAFPFRFKKSAGNKKQPLIILFCGAGGLGVDNFKPLVEFTLHLLKLQKYNCNILIPQTINKTNNAQSYDDFNKGLDRYISSVKLLAEKLIEENQIDTSRIYVVGTSFGGFCTWRSGYLFPDFYTAIIPVIGGYNIKTDDEVYNDFSKLANMPIWAAHSSDDKLVSCEFDNYAVGELEKIGGKIKYSLWNKYGHAMASHFYRKEKWAQWLLNQRKDN